MSSLKTGDLVVLISGSMRMAVEAVDGDQIACVWCNEGEIGRDNFNTALLRKWEYREDHGSDQRGGGRPHRGGDRDRDSDRGGDRGGRGGHDRDRGPRRDNDDRKPKGKTGWDGKPREKKYFRKDDRD